MANRLYNKQVSPKGYKDGNTSESMKSAAKQAKRK